MKIVLETSSAACDSDEIKVCLRHTRKARWPVAKTLIESPISEAGFSSGHPVWGSIKTKTDTTNGCVLDWGISPSKWKWWRNWYTIDLGVPYCQPNPYIEIYIYIDGSLPTTNKASSQKPGQPGLLLGLRLQSLQRIFQLHYQGGHSNLLLRIGKVLGVDLQMGTLEKSTGRDGMKMDETTAARRRPLTTSVHPCTSPVNCLLQNLQNLT